MLGLPQDTNTTKALCLSRPGFLTGQRGRLGEGTEKRNMTKTGGEKKGGLTFTHNTVLAWEEMDEQGQL